MYLFVLLWIRDQTQGLTLSGKVPTNKENPHYCLDFLFACLFLVSYMYVVYLDHSHHPSLEFPPPQHIFQLVTPFFLNITWVLLVLSTRVVVEPFTGT